MFLKAPCCFIMIPSHKKCEDLQDWSCFYIRSPTKNILSLFFYEGDFSRNFPEIQTQDISSKTLPCFIMFLETVIFPEFFKKFCPKLLSCFIMFLETVIFPLFRKILSQDVFSKFFSLFHYVLGNGDFSRVFLEILLQMFLHSFFPVLPCVWKR